MQTSMSKSGRCAGLFTAELRPQALSDDQLRELMSAARDLPINRRGDFLPGRRRARPAA
jgi:hypothetical protein